MRIWLRAQCLDISLESFEDLRTALEEHDPDFDWAVFGADSGWWCFLESLSLCGYSDLDLPGLLVDLNDLGTQEFCESIPSSVVPRGRAKIKQILATLIRWGVVDEPACVNTFSSGHAAAGKSQWEAPPGCSSEEDNGVDNGVDDDDMMYESEVPRPSSKMEFGKQSEGQATGKGANILKGVKQENSKAERKQKKRQKQAIKREIQKVVGPEGEHEVNGDVALCWRLNADFAPDTLPGRMLLWASRKYLSTGAWPGKQECRSCFSGQANVKQAADITMGLGLHAKEQGWISSGTQPVSL